MNATPRATQTITIMPTAGVPSVWIGCLACYNSGRLVGEWFAATTAANVTIDQLHHGVGVTDCDGEELWVMDTDNMPVTEEMSPERAQRCGELLEEVGPEHADALRAWIATGTHSVDAQGMPTIDAFREGYVGTSESWQDYVEHAAFEMDLFNQVPEHLRCYIDLTRWGRDLAFDYATEAAAGGGVHVFLVI